MSATSLKTPPENSLGTKDATSRPRSRSLRGRGWIALAVLLIVIYFLPTIVALTSLRNLPLRMVFAGIEGTITCQGTSLGWFSAVEFTGVQVCDRNGAVVLDIPSVSIDRTPLGLIVNRSRLGKVTVQKPDLRFTAAGASSNFEDVFLPWWNTPSAGPIELDLAIEDGTVELRDEKADGTWKLRSLTAALQLTLDDTAPASWSASAHVADREGGSFAVSGSKSTGAIELKSQKLPLEMFRWIARRLCGDVDLSGELSCELAWQTQQPAGDSHSPGQALRGQIALANFIVSGGGLQGDTVRLRQLTVEADCLFADGRSNVRRLLVNSDVGTLKAQGVFTAAIPTDTATIEAFSRQPFNVEGSLDLARLAQMLPKTLHLRSDTVINAGTVNWQLSSEAAAEDHRWRAHVESSGLAATSGGKPLRWEKPIAIELLAPVRSRPRGRFAGLLVRLSSGQRQGDDRRVDRRFDL